MYGFDSRQGRFDAMGASQPDSTTSYIPGVCNIGPTEIKMRRAVGWTGLTVCVVLWTALVVFKVAAPWRLVLFLPAFVAAIGFLQAAWHFCAKFGLGGVFNFGPNVGRTDTLEQAEFRNQDRRKALRIIGLSLLVAFTVAAAGYLTAR
jgi:hypothetical protein